MFMAGASPAAGDVMASARAAVTDALAIQVCQQPLRLWVAAIGGKFVEASSASVRSSRQEGG
jgi:hypothetical protein